LIDSGNTRKYLLYAIGEIVLVVIGILIALQINNWNAKNLEKDAEIKILEDLHKTLSEDLVQFKATYNNVRNAEDKTQILQNILKTNSRVDTLSILCGAVYGAHNFNLTTSSYEILKSSGLNLIKDDSIKNLIVKIFDTHLKYILGCNQIEIDVVLNALRPYYLSHFSNIRFYKSAIPIDVDDLYKDAYFHNLVDYRLTVFRNNILSNHPKIAADIEKLLIRIEKYLK
jgi:hypothetical protein